MVVMAMAAVAQEGVAVVLAAAPGADTQTM
jgi:hypothetical protein